MRWSIERKVMAGFTLAVLMLTVSSVVTYQNARTFMRTVQESARTRSLLIEIGDISLLMARAEIAQRDYVLTGQARFLRSYQASFAAMRKEVEDLRTLTISSSLQRQRVDALAPLIARKFAALQTTISLREEQGLSSAIRKLSSESDPTAAAEIQSMVQEIEQEAQASLQKHTSRAREGEYMTIVIILIGSLLTFLLLTVAGWWICHDLQERRRAERALRQARDELEQHVEERTRELAAANTALHLLSRQLLETQENERRHIARELHDELGQGLTSVKFGLQMLEDMKNEKAEATPLRECIDSVDSMLQQVRQLSLNLRPSLLDDLGLIAAVDWYVKRQGEQLGLTIHFTPMALHPRPDSVIETACFRVVQEAFTNIARHAHAHQVWVNVFRDGHTLSVSVRDDGSGFSVEEARRRATRGGSLGVLGMEERMTLVGGQLEIHSDPGKGTEVIARAPLC